MKPTTLKELLKPPCKLWEDGDIANSDGLIIARSMLHKSFSYAYPYNRPLLQESGEFITAAINEKLERDFGEPLRWEVEGKPADYYLFRCPKCKGIHNQMYNYCPSCGQRLMEVQDD